MSLITEVSLDDGRILQLTAVRRGIVRIRLSSELRPSIMERYGIVDATGDPDFEPNGIDDELMVWINTESKTLSAITPNNNMTIQLCSWGRNNEWVARREFYHKWLGEEDLRGNIIIGDPNGAREKDREPIPRPHVSQSFGFAVKVTSDERFYGLGESASDKLQLRGDVYSNWVQYQKNEGPSPFILSSNGWGIFINTSWRHLIDVCACNKDELVCYGEQGELDFFILYGGSMPGVLERYTTLTGKPMLLPKWAYGHTYIGQMKADQFEITHDAREMRDHKIPCDMISLEPGWMETHYDMSLDKRWNLERFYIPEWMRRGNKPCKQSFISALKRYGYKLSLWLCCNHDLTMEAERKAKGLPYDPAISWYEHLKGFVNDGVDGFKLDPCAIVDSVHPGKVYANGRTEEEMHNLNQTLLVKQMAEGFITQTGRRPMHHFCGSYAGVQRYTATTTGDNGGGNGALVWILNHGLSAHMNTSCDMDSHSKEGIHMGFLIAWSHLNSWCGFSQPWWLGNEMEIIYRDYAGLRYSLLPYIYSTAISGYQSAMPMVRAMPLAFPEDAATYNATKQFMLGPWLLVGAFTNEIHLPLGEWRDYWTGKVYSGPVDIKYQAPSNRGGALFMRRGAIVPMASYFDHLEAFDDRQIELLLDPYLTTAYEFLEDNGIDLGYMNGEHSRTNISLKERKDRVDLYIDVRHGKYSGMPTERIWRLKIIMDKPPVDVLVGNVRINYEYDVDSKHVLINVAEQASGLHIQLIK